MSEWKKTQLPPEDKHVLGIWQTVTPFEGECMVKHQCFINDGKFYSTMFDGETVEVPIPHYWKFDEDFPKEEE